MVWVGAGCAGRLLPDWLNDGWAGFDGAGAAGCGLLAATGVLGATGAAATGAAATGAEATGAEATGAEGALDAVDDAEEDGLAAAGLARLCAGGRRLAACAGLRATTTL
jgi:hypothetical protein